jgi:hypothetical protein
MGETAATEAKRRGNAEGVRNAPFAKSLEKQGAETWKWKEGLYPLSEYNVFALTSGQGLLYPTCRL